MTSTTHYRRSANEKGIEELQKETLNWDNLFQTHTEEIHFYKELLSSDVFEGNLPNLYERLQNFYDKLQELKREKINLHEELHHHRNDLNGMMECEDISCETFYYNQHEKLEGRINSHFSKVLELKKEIIRFTTPLLRKNKD